MDLCQPGYHWDFQANACVPDEQRAPQPGGMLQPQQQQGQQQQMPNMQMLQQMMGGGGGLTGTAIGGQGYAGGALQSSQMVFPDLVGASAGGGGGGGGGGFGALANPYSALAAAVLGGGAALQHNNVSSVPHMLKGQWGDDIINSPNVKNFLGNILGQGGEQAARSGAQPFADMIAPSKWKNIPKDLWGGVKEPLSWLKGLL